MNELPHNHPLETAVQDADLRELEAELRRFRSAPLPPAVQQRMLAAVTAAAAPQASAPHHAHKTSYSRYLAPLTALFLLAIVAYSLPQVPNTPMPLYVPMLACLAGILMLTNRRPHPRKAHAPYKTA